MLRDFTGCTVIIYDENGEQLINTKILVYDKDGNQIEVMDSPALVNDAICKVLIMSPPVPYRFHGRVHRQRAGNRFITLFKGDASDNRHDSRFNINQPAIIVNYVCDDNVYKLHTPLEVTLVNISKHGIRIRTDAGALSINDEFQLCIKNDDKGTVLTAYAVNVTQVPPGRFEFGCRLVYGEEHD